MDDREPEKQVIAELTLSNQIDKVTIRGRHDANVCLSRLDTA